MTPQPTENSGEAWFCECFHCSRLAVHTENSPYMDGYCEPCTLNRCDAYGHPAAPFGVSGPTENGSD